MASSNTLRIILCGKSTQLALTVKAGLLPEYEVIHIILSPEAGASEIPPLLAGHGLPRPARDHDPQQEPSNLGSAPAPISAVVLGGGYGDDESVRRLRAACAGERGVPWLRPDVSVPTPPPGLKYGAHVVGRVKACLRELEEEGRAVGDGVYFY
ncbi:hypothetical protein MBM_00865 [Drepanopeziza brunnea f. sp. 'multigermtubi' MB_m1]|uniref:Uncharacterized protein n=1 Tax=Marssonina brunnea f. sp. multigermtubi (strain MB_m1) TaxID=1072389 RepID=K1X9S2_MARBU|nr:uncharacterized protein MBM_00865 [Drepanopeziza brunnea f. sp. 'multigermtubi' MB_m1]EKD21752.1 hypothetical protein MBM_00865 [Drepanopeziza brunnea f. sp. 'multigermtubi' MB_m1]